MVLTALSSSERISLESTVAATSVLSFIRFPVFVADRFASFNDVLTSSFIDSPASLAL
jgi:hypothetical protein